MRSEQVSDTKPIVCMWTKQLLAFYQKPHYLSFLDWLLPPSLSTITTSSAFHAIMLVRVGELVDFIMCVYVDIYRESVYLYTDTQNKSYFIHTSYLFLAKKNEIDDRERSVLLSLLVFLSLSIIGDYRWK